MQFVDGIVARASRLKAATNKLIFDMRFRTHPFSPEWLGEVGPFRQHHPVFAEFDCFKGVVPVEFDVDFIGARARHDALCAFVPRLTEAVTTVLPAVNEEYFEWLDLLLSVRDAGSTYTMVELGAGMGAGRCGLRWQRAARGSQIFASGWLRRSPHM